MDKLSAGKDHRAKEQDGMTTTIQAAPATRAALDDPGRGEPCDLAAPAGTWRARRLGGRAPLTAASAEEPRELTAAGHAARPGRLTSPPRNTR
jgi:hypothetical protein